MTKRSRTVFLMLCVLAMAGAQVFGLVQGYLCDCNDTPVVTESDHCHGVHDDKSSVVTFFACERDDKNLPSQDERREHVLQKEEIKGRPSETVRVVQPNCVGVAQPMLADVFATILWGKNLLQIRSRVDACPPVQGRRSALWATTVALRV